MILIKKCKILSKVFKLIKKNVISMIGNSNIFISSILSANQWFYKCDKKRLHVSEFKIALSFFGSNLVQFSEDLWHFYSAYSTYSPSLIYDPITITMKNFTHTVLFEYEKNKNKNN